MYAKWCAVVLWMLLPTVADADLFETARQQVNVQTSRSDSSGFSTRGGVNLSTGAASTATIFRGQASVGGGCNAFDFASSFKELFETIPQVIEGLTQHLASSIPMLVICYTSPTACDLLKHFQSYVNVLLQARYAQCQGAQHAAMYAGLKLRGGQVTHCLDAQRRQGVSISRAMDVCNTSAFDLRNPDGSMGREVRLIQDTLRAAGATTEVQTLAGGLMGEMTLRAGEQLGIESRHPQAALLVRYDSHKERYEAALTRAADELQQTGTVTAPTLRAVAVPGQPLPRAAIEALAAMRSDPTRYPTMVGRLSTGLALTQLTWECTDLQNQLTAAAEGNAHLSEEERLNIEKKVQALRHDIAQFMLRSEVVEKHYVPAVDALLREYAAMQAAATSAGLRAPSIQMQTSPYGHQSPIGYSK